LFQAVESRAVYTLSVINTNIYTHFRLGNAEYSYKRPAFTVEETTQEDSGPRAKRRREAEADPEQGK